jgi:hypothetical protein
MPEVPAIALPSHLWKSLSVERKLRAAEAFWKDENAGAEQAEAIVVIAQRIKFRPKSVAVLPVEKKAKHLSTLLGVSEMMAARLLVAYHLEHQRPMMGSFLDALGIKHENGMIAEDDVQPPGDAALKKAAAAIGQAYPAEDVSLYLSTLLWQDMETWGPLADAPERLAAVRA